MAETWESLQRLGEIESGLDGGSAASKELNRLVRSLELRLEGQSEGFQKAPSPFTFTNFVEGELTKGEFVPWNEATLPAMTHAAHYGTSVYEGIRFYKTDRGPAIFKLDEHIDRFFYSASSLHMELPYSKEELKAAICQTVRLSGHEDGYIRPIAMYGQKMGLVTEGAPVIVAVMCWKWGRYLPNEEASVMIGSTRRLSPNAFDVKAKIGGHYVNSVRSGDELRGTEFDEALLLDEDGYVSEGPGENIFIVKDGKVITPTEKNILLGITRQTAIDIAEKLGIPVSEEDIPPQDLFSIDEAFFTGTAAEITPIRSIDNTPVGSGAMGDVTGAIRGYFTEMKVGNTADVGHLTYVLEETKEPDLSDLPYLDFVKHVAATRTD